jgi:hypothetical protein
MPWLLLGICTLQEPRPGWIGLTGALLYGAAFTYFAHTTLYALAEGAPSYAALWRQLGAAYTINGALMVLGGLLFAGSALRFNGLPRPAVLLFVSGILVNSILSVLPAPEMLQTLGSALRNVGLMAMGYAVLFSPEALQDKRKQQPT